MVSTSKYMEIVSWAKEQIAAGAFLPGDRFLSENELSEKFGFSRQTVRRALEEMEKEGHIARIQGSGTYISAYQPFPRRGQGGEGAASRFVAVLSTHIDGTVFPPVLRGIEAALRPGGYAVQLHATQNEVIGETRALEGLLSSIPAGVIVHPTRSALPCLNLPLFQRLQDMGVPVVFIDSGYPGLLCPCVALDDEKAGFVATAHLLDAGHLRVAGIFSALDQQGRLRYLGYARALLSRGIPLDDSRVHWFTKENLEYLLAGGPLPEALKGCTAAVCYNDNIALSLMEKLPALGLSVPKDLSLVGVDNSEVGRVAQLSSVAHPGDRLGEAAAKLLLSMIGGAPGKSILFPPQLMARGTVSVIHKEGPYAAE